MSSRLHPFCRISPSRVRGLVYWGPGPLPQGATLLGAVTSPDGKSGALLKMPTGILMRGNAGAIASLPYVPDPTQEPDRRHRRSDR